MKKQVKFLVEEVEGGFTAYADGWAIYTEGDTLAYVWEMMHDALSLQCEETGEDFNGFEIVAVFGEALAASEPGEVVENRDSLSKTGTETGTETV